MHSMRSSVESPLLCQGMTPPVFFIAFLCNNFLEKCNILEVNFSKKKSIMSQSWYEVENHSLFHFYCFFMLQFPPKSGILSWQSQIHVFF